MEQHRWGMAAAMLGVLFVVFVGMGSTVLGVVQGTPGTGSGTSPFRDGLLNTLPTIVLLAMSFGMGLALPEAIQGMVREAASYVAVQR
jgi:formate hydrogenlyase subunit 3/multisubunit Na+/H+ antiporter MnhD subunit